MFVHGGPSSGTRVVPCRETDLTKLTVAFRNYAKAPLVVPYTTMNTAGCNAISAASGRSVFTIGPELFHSPCSPPPGLSLQRTYIAYRIHALLCSPSVWMGKMSPEHWCSSIKLYKRHVSEHFELHYHREFQHFFDKRKWQLFLHSTWDGYVLIFNSLLFIEHEITKELTTGKLTQASWLAYRHQ
jgi:hypothetical protein